MNREWRVKKYTVGNGHHVSASYWAHGRSFAPRRHRCLFRYGTFINIVKWCGRSVQEVDCQRRIRKRTTFYNIIIWIFSSLSDSFHIFSLLSFNNGKREQDYKTTALSMCLRLSELKTCEPIDRLSLNLVWKVRNWMPSFLSVPYSH
jgi:hypothetical protein